MEGAKFWCTKSDLVDVHSVKHVVMGCVLMKGVLEDDKLPQTCRIKEATSMGAQKIQSADHDRILDEIFRREKLDNPDCGLLKKKLAKEQLKDCWKRMKKNKRNSAVQFGFHCVNRFALNCNLDGSQILAPGTPRIMG